MSVTSTTSAFGIPSSWPSLHGSTHTTLFPSSNITVPWWTGVTLSSPADVVNVSVAVGAREPALAIGAALTAPLGVPRPAAGAVDWALLTVGAGSLCVQAVSIIATVII